MLENSLSNYKIKLKIEKKNPKHRNSLQISWCLGFFKDDLPFCFLSLPGQEELSWHEKTFYVILSLFVLIMY